MTRLLKPFTFLSLFLCLACSYDEMNIEQDEYLLSMSAISSAKVDSAIFYYSSGKKVYLSEDKGVILICFKDEKAKALGLSSIRSEYHLSSWKAANQKESVTEDENTNIAIVQSARGKFSQEDIAKLKKRDDIIHVAYLTEYNGFYSAPTNEFLVKLKNKSDYQMLHDLVEKFSCAFVDDPWIGENVYVISVPKSSELTAVEIANILSESGRFIYSSPNFYLIDCFFSNDQYYNLQWGLWHSYVSSQNNDSSIETAWAITEGSSDVVVAVIDTGVELNHPDLQGQLVPGFDAVRGVSGGGPRGTSRFHSHGTRVAGIIAAKKDNSIGLSGVAPECRIMPINVGTNDIIDERASVSAINWAIDHGADVINLSWGSHTPSPDHLNGVIARAISVGRNGKGSVIVAASGKDGRSSVPYPAVLDPVLAVGAHSVAGMRLNFSDYGTGLNVTAPGDMMVTTDLIGSAGGNSGQNFEDLLNLDYTKTFQGTSAAAPLVSGIAALIISKYPDLSQEQVRRAIELGCDRPSGYTYQIDNKTPFGLWNNQVGYGNVNAYSALLKAEDFHQENVANSIPGIDFNITNESSYAINNIYVRLTGIIDGSYFTFFSSDPGSLDSNQSVGFPTFRGENITDPPGSLITDLELEIYAECPDYSGNLRFSAYVDGSPYIDLLSFDQGNTYYVPLADTTVPNASRKKLIIHIMDPLN